MAEKKAVGRPPAPGSTPAPRSQVNNNPGAEDRLVAMWKAAGFRSARAAALAINVNPSTFLQHARGDRTISAIAAKQYAVGLDGDWKWLLTGVRQSGIDEESAIKSAKTHGLVTARIVPILDANMRQTGEIPSPPHLTHVPDVIAYVMHDMSMAPRFFPEEVLFADKHRYPKAGAFVIATLPSRKLVVCQALSYVGGCWELASLDGLFTMKTAPSDGVRVAVISAVKTA